jgi:hypothetical protein
VPALAQWLERQPAPFMAGDVLLVTREPGGGGIVEDQVDIELEQIDRPPEHRLLDGVAVLGQDVQGAVELVKAEVARLGQPYPIEPALVAGELGARPGEALRHHGQKGGRMRCRQLLLIEPGLDRLADAELGPECLGHMHDPELEAGLDRDGGRPCGRGGDGPTSLARQDPLDACDQPLQGCPVELVGPAEAVHHPGLDIALLGMTNVLGECQVAHHRAVLVPPLGGP